MGYLLLVQVIAVGGFILVQVAGGVGRVGRLLAWLGAGRGVHRIDGAVRTFYRSHWRALFLSIGFHFASWLVGAVEALLILQSLHVPASLVTATVIEALGTGVRFATFFMPASLGTLEGANAAAFTALGWAASDGLAFSFVRRGRQVVWIGLGLVILVAMGATRAAGRCGRRPCPPAPTDAAPHATRRVMWAASARRRAGLLERRRRGGGHDDLQCAGLDLELIPLRPETGDGHPLPSADLHAGARSRNAQVSPQQLAEDLPTGLRPQDEDVEEAVDGRRVRRQRQPGAVRRHVGHDDERRVDGDEATVHDDSQPRRRRFAKMVEGGAIVGEPPLPPRPGRGGAALHGLLDLGDQAVALLAQEQLAVARPDVRRDDLAAA